MQKNTLYGSFLALFPKFEAIGMSVKYVSTTYRRTELIFIGPLCCGQAQKIFKKYITLRKLTISLNFTNSIKNHMSSNTDI